MSERRQVDEDDTLSDSHKTDVPPGDWESNSAGSVETKSDATVDVPSTTSKPTAGATAKLARLACGRDASASSTCPATSSTDATQGGSAERKQEPEGKAAAPSSEARPPKRTPSEELNRIKQAKRLREKRRKKRRKQEAQELLAAKKQTQS